MTEPNHPPTATLTRQQQRAAAREEAAAYYGLRVGEQTQRDRDVRRGRVAC